MSEKRILIKEFTISPCTGCSGAGKNDCDNCYDWDTWNSCLTREQAIEKIAKAICRTDGENCITCGFNYNEKGCKEYLKFGDYITQAKAALNALLEANNEN